LVVKMKFGLLLELARAPSDHGEDVIRTFYNWRHDRALTLVRGALAFAASLVLGLGIALFKAEIRTPWWTVVLTLVAASLVAGYGVNVLVRMIPKLHEEYLVAVRLFEALRRAFAP
jgi:hypothetical protein